MVETLFLAISMLHGDREGQENWQPYFQVVFQIQLRLQEYFEPIVYSIRKTSSKKFSVLLPDLPPSLM